MPRVDGEGQRPLVIGIDARAATEVQAGRGRVVRELLRALGAREDAYVYRCYARRRWEEPLDERFEWSLIDAPDPMWHVRAGVAASRACDVFLSTNSYLMTLLVSVPTLTIVYDLFALDRRTQPNRRSALVERLTLQPAVRRSDLLWCISQATADALIAACPRSAIKAAVVPLAASSGLSDGRAGEGTDLPNPGFVLAVGTLEPRKNLPRLVEAYRLLPGQLQDSHPLVVVGARGWRTGETLNALRSLGPRCLMLGHVSDAGLGELYRRCGVFCYPSLGEGFGLPVLEAMAAGAPVVTSDVSSLPEVGREAVEYVDPYSVESIANGLQRVLDSPERCAELRALALRRAAQFSWARTAADVLGLLNRAYEGSGVTGQQDRVSR